VRERAGVRVRNACLVIVIKDVINALGTEGAAPKARDLKSP
jgi:hypothetical protein